eukprot:scaffold145820_cov41-Prasinocladus_malaysianus.AAC.2
MYSGDNLRRMTPHEHCVSITENSVLLEARVLRDSDDSNKKRKKKEEKRGYVYRIGVEAAKHQNPYQ